MWNEVREKKGRGQKNPTGGISNAIRHDVLVRLLSLIEDRESRTDSLLERIKAANGLRSEEVKE